MESDSRFQDTWEWENLNNFKHTWVSDAQHDHEPSTSESQSTQTEAQEKDELGLRARALYKEYGTNEPYTEPEDVPCYNRRDPTSFFKLMTGPSTNFYVGREARHYTIPKRLLYHYSDYARLCLEGHFSEAAANATWLPDVDPDVFQWLWLWLYTGKLKVYRFYYGVWGLSEDERLQQTCRVLCRLHILGERLLFDDRLLEQIRRKMGKVVEIANRDGRVMPLTPEIVEEVLSESAPVQYEPYWKWYIRFLRHFVVSKLCTFGFCTTTDFMDWIGCFELDGAFAAEMMAYMADELKWAVKRWEAQVGSPVEVLEKEKRISEDQGIYQWVEKRSKNPQGVWLALRFLCTFAGCTKTDLRTYSPCFELDGTFAAEILRYMAGEWRWVVERWGEERGWKVDVVAEREDEERDAQEKSDRQHMVDKIMRRQGWS